MTGSRDWNDEIMIENIFSKIEKPCLLIHGNCIGADKLCEKVGKKYNFDMEVHNPEWNKYGKYAGPKRNKDMIESFINHTNCKNKIMYAFHDSIEKSKGTKNCVQEAKKNNIDTIIISHSNSDV